MRNNLLFKIPRITRRFTSPEVWPLGVALLMLVCSNLMHRHIQQAEPLAQLPVSSGVCVRSFTTYDITIDKDNRIYFSIEDKNIQAAVIQHVANQHDIHLTDWQLHELHKLPYIGIDVRLLPTTLNMPRFKRYALQQGLPASTSNNQLSELIGATRTIYPALTGRSIFCAIRIDKRVPFAQVKALIKLLGSHNVHRFNIKTYMQ